MEPRRAVAFAVAWAAFLLLFLAGGGAIAEHNLPLSPISECYDCHSLSGATGAVEDGTKGLSKSSMTQFRNNGWASGAPVPCTYCHRSANAPIVPDVLSSFSGSTPQDTSRHPVARNFATGSIDNIPYTSADNTANAQHLDCRDCHDVSLVGSPTHAPGWWNSTNPSNAQKRSTNRYGLKNVSAPKAFDDLCRSCHQSAAAFLAFTGKSGAGATKLVLTTHDNGADNAANAIRDLDNTHLKTQDNVTPAEKRQCTICHDAHESTSLHLFSDGHEKTSDNVTPEQWVDESDCTTVCHYNGDAQNSYLTHGHGKAKSFSDNTLGYACTKCHDASRPHKPGDPDYFVRYRFTPYTQSWNDNSVFGNRKFSICVQCHPQKPAHNTTRGAVGCLDCHDQHGKNSDNNIMMIRSRNKVAGSIIGVTGPGAAAGTEPVRFEKGMKYPASSPYDFYSTLPYQGDNAAGFCDQRACHGNRVVNGVALAPLNNYLVDNVHSEGYQSPGSNCESCHSHADPVGGAFRATSSCTVCHGQPPPPGNTSYLFNESMTPHAKHAAAAQYGFDCRTCHANYTNSSYHITTPATYQSVFFSDLRKRGGVPADPASYYDNTNLACKNLTCHSDGRGGPPNVDNVKWYNPAQWWAPQVTLDCAGCHNNETPLARMATGAHIRHLDRPYACSTCHTRTMTDNNTDLLSTSAHLSMGDNNFNHSADVDFKAINGATGVWNNALATCDTVYCHGNGGTPALSGGANQATANRNFPKWDNAASSRCGSCHGAPGATTNYPSATGTQNYPTSGFHGRHMAAGNDNAGPAITACTDCHTTDAVTTHIDGKVDFRTSHLDNTPSTLSATRTCDPCHGTGVSDAKAQWNNTAYRLDCLTCHGAVRAAAHADNTGRFAPDVAGDNATYGALVRGHNRPSGSNYPVTNNPPARLACTACHNPALRHIDNIDNTSYSGNRLADNVQVSAAPPTYVANITTVTGLCSACHSTSGSAAVNRSVNTHGNAGYAKNLENQPASSPPAPGAFTTTCDQCHEPHGMVSSPAGPNLWMINPSIQVNGATTVDNVVFTAKTGANSFNNTKGTGFLAGYGAIKELCVVCHAVAANPGQPMTYNVAGWHNAPSYKGDDTGKDCSGCHTHNQDDNTTTVDGLMPEACNGCHSYPELDNATSSRQMSRGHWKHVGKPGPGGKDNSMAYPCSVCHSGYTHNQSGFGPGDPWIAGYWDNVNINFDNAVVPGALQGNSTPRTYNLNPVPTSGNGGTGQCAGVSCHGNASSQTGWGGSIPVPRWDNVNGAPCGSCHDTGTGDATPGTSLSTKNHPAHLSAAYGPGLSAFDNNGNCSFGQGCHTAYGLSPLNTHVNGKVGLRASLSDNTEVTGLENTAVCRYCHSVYTSANIPVSGDNLVRIQANWDNASYKVACVTCHNDAPSGNTPPNTRGTQTIGGGGHQAPNVEAAYFTNGHGAISIDNSVTTGDNGVVDRVPPVRCETCHDEVGLHIGTAKDAVNPYRLDNALTRFAQSGGLDNACLTQCHSTTFNPAKHAWIVSGIGASAKDNTVQTHPTSTAVVPSGKGRWFLVPSDNVMPVLADLASKSPPARDNGSILLCVTCHDPHGVGTATLPATMRTFSGANTEAAGSKSMLRYNYSGKVSGQSPLCAKCHK